jgi:hypothetical protein
MNEVARANERPFRKKKKKPTDEAVPAEEARPNEGGPWSNISAALGCGLADMPATLWEW